MSVSNCLSIDVTVSSPEIFILEVDSLFGEDQTFLRAVARELRRPVIPVVDIECHSLSRVLITTEAGAALYDPEDLVGQFRLAVARRWAKRRRRVPVEGIGYRRVFIDS